jgi:hypothetical protein
LARLETFGILLVNGKKAQPTHEEGLPLSARKLLNHEDKAVDLKRELSSFVDARKQDGHDYHQGLVEQVPESNLQPEAIAEVRLWILIAFEAHCSGF